MTSHYNSPLGWLEIVASQQALLGIHFLDKEPDKTNDDLNPVIAQTTTELTEYFEGKRTDFSVPMQTGGTNFQQSVWELLSQIPYGQTISYGQLAQQLGDSNKIRAVGKANGQNPIPIIIPCHRVIGANNKLVGYAGGIKRKKFLLKHEGALLL